MKSLSWTKKLFFTANTFSGPWFCFWGFFTINLILAYAPLSLPLKWSLAILGLAFPFLIGLRKKGPPDLNPLFFVETFSMPPIWIWVLVVLGAFAFRFFKLTSFLGFPIVDEAIKAFYAMDLGEKWTWHPLLYLNQPPLYIWVLAWIFKLGGASLFLLWLIPAILSLLSVGFSYFSASVIFSRSFSFLVFFFTALSFWPGFVGRFSHEAVLMLMWEWITLLALGLWIKGSPGFQKRIALVFLAFCIGVGFYTYLDWVLVGLGFGLVVILLLARQRNSGRVLDFLFFGGVVFSTILPLVLSTFHEDYTSYPLDLLALKNPPPTGHALSFLNYFSILFWSTPRLNFSYGPMWGGLLSPVQGSFFLLGLQEFWRFRRNRLVLGIGVIFLLFYIPILFTNNFNVFRMISLLPIVLLSLALGFQRLMEESRRPAIRKLLWSLTLLSMVLDGINLEKSAAEINRFDSAQKPPDYVRAYEILQRTSGEKGPGLFFASFAVNEIRAPFLDVATYPFNAVLNPQIPSAKCTWVAVLTNVHYQPFLNKRYPGGKVYWLSKDHPPPDGGLMLWVEPLSSGSLEDFLRWKKADLSLKPFKEANLLKKNGQSDRTLLDPLFRAYPYFQGDSFLEASFWEKVADVQFQNVLLRSLRMTRGLSLSEMPSGQVPFDGVNRSTLEAPLQTLATAIQKGYPAAHLYFRMGTLLMLAQDPVHARWAFRKAEQAPLDFTDSKRYLRSSSVR